MSCDDTLHTVQLAEEDEIVTEGVLEITEPTYRNLLMHPRLAIGMVSTVFSIIM